MSIGKKLIAYVMSVAMVVGTIPMSAVAAEGEGTTDGTGFTVTAYVIDNEGGTVEINVISDETTEKSEQTKAIEVQEEFVQDGSVSQQVSAGNKVEIKASPDNAEYEFAHWCSDAEGKNQYTPGEGITVNGSTITIERIRSDIKVYAKFEKNAPQRYQVTAECMQGSEEGKESIEIIEPSGSNGEVTAGTNVTVQACAKEGWYIEGWYEDVSGTEEHKLKTSNDIVIDDTAGTCTIKNVHQEWHLYVKFEKNAPPKYQVTAECMQGSEEGKESIEIIEPSGSNGEVTAGTNVTVQACAKNGWHVDGWYSDLEGQNELLGEDVTISTDKTTCTITNIQTDVTVYVKFAKHTYREPKSWIWTKTESGYSAAAIFICETCSKQVQSSPVTATKTFVKEATCTSAGQIEYIASVTFEGKVYSDKKTGETIPPKGHKLSKTPAKPATCTASGNKEYYTCGMCHAHFADNGGRTGIAQNSWIINAKGHSIASRVDKKPTDKKEGSIVKGCGVCGYVEDRLVIPKKKLTLNLGKSAKLVSNARGCTFTLANAKKYGKYFKVDEKTGKVTTKKDYSTKIKKSIPIKVTVGGQTYTVTAKIKIPAPSVKITRKKAGDRYRYTFKYNIPKADKIKVRSNLKGMNTKVVDKYLSQPKSNADSYINLDLGKMKKVKFKIVAYYGKNVSETRVITK